MRQCSVPEQDGPMAGAFDRTTLKGIELPNRFVRSATNEGTANADGTVNQRLIKLLEELAKNDVGLVIPGYAYVSDQGKSRPGQIGVQNDDTLEGLCRMAEAVHRHGSAIALQLAHTGGNAYVPMEEGYALGPSGMMLTDIPCKEMTKDDIRRTIADFASAAARAKRAGMDAVQLHGAHSYLVSQFVSPYFNRRTDEYGGDIRGRMQITTRTTSH